MNAGVGASGGGGIPAMVGPAPGKGAENIPKDAEQWTIDMAIRCSQKCGVPADWMWAQWCNESGHFHSTLAEQNHNYAGITSSGTSTSNLVFMNFDSPDAFADYFAWYIARWDNPPAIEAKDFRDYIHRLQTQNDGSRYCDDPPGDIEYYNACVSTLGNAGTVIS